MLLNEPAFIVEPKIAPSQQVAIFVRRKDLKQQIVHINLLTDEQTVWTSQEGEISSVVWTPDSHSVLFLLKNNDVAQVYKIDCKQNLKQLTAVTGGVASFYYRSDDELLWLETVENAKILRWSIKEQQATRFMPSVEQQLLAYSNNGQHMLTIDLAEQALYMVHIATETRDCIDLYRHNFSHAAFSFYDQYVAYVAQEKALGEVAYPAVYVYDLQTGITQNLTEMMDAPVGHITMRSHDTKCWQRINWTETDALYFPLSVMDDVRLYYADLYGSMFPASSEEEHVMDFDIAYSGNWAIMVVSRATVQQEIIFLDITTGEQRSYK